MNRSNNLNSAFFLKFVLALASLSILASCTQVTEGKQVASGEAKLQTKVQACTNTACQQERDEIYTLLAFSIVLKDWQTEAEYGTDSERGHNIGSVLVDKSGNVVFWARNCNAITDDASQHGEVRLIRSFLATNRPAKYLDGYSIYTTLEPCAMCSGMMALTRVTRAVYGQTDPSYGRAIERLALDSTKLKDPNNGSFIGFKPYPRLFQSDLAPTTVTTQLDSAFHSANQSDITKWLRSDDARAIYERANTQLISYTPTNSENQSAISAARQLLAAVPNHYVPFTFDDP